MNFLEKECLRVVVFFDAFDYPVTVSEVHQLLGVSASLDAVMEVLTQRSTMGILESAKMHSGDRYYFLPGRSQMVAERVRRNEISQTKLDRIRERIKMLSRLPCVYAIAISNKLAYRNAEDDDDIDLFILTAPGRLWTARYWVNTYLTLVRRRVYGKHSVLVSIKAYLARFFGILSENTTLVRDDRYADAFCTPFFVTTQADLAAARATTADISDIYYEMWAGTLLPIVGKDLFAKYMNQQHWFRERFPNKTFIGDAVPESRKVNFFRVFSWCAWAIPEQWYCWIQRLILPSELRAQINTSTSVMITEHILKFHSKDRREEYNRAFERRYAAYLEKYA